MSAESWEESKLDMQVITGAARLAELEQMYWLGNKMALYDLVAETKRLNLPLPDWAVGPLQSAFVAQWKTRRSKWKPEPQMLKGNIELIKGGYIAMLARYVRSEVYRSTAKWVKDTNNYRTMPTACIEAWFDGEWKRKPTGEDGAIEVALVGLADTFAACEDTTLREHRYFGADPETDKLIIEDEVSAAHFEMTPSEYSSWIKSELKDARRLPLSFGYNATEVLFGLRPEGQFWGPKREPPEEIRKLLTPQSISDFLEENS